MSPPDPITELQQYLNAKLEGYASFKKLIDELDCMLCHKEAQMHTLAGIHIGIITTLKAAAESRTDGLVQMCKVDDKVAELLKLLTKEKHTDG